MLSLYQPLWKLLNNLDLSNKIIQQLITTTEKKLLHPTQGDYSRWFQAYKDLPEITTLEKDLSNNVISCVSKAITPSQLDCIDTSLKNLIPWRKGPFKLFDTFVDAEWQSNLKWNRIESKIPSLHNKRVLDIGCGNGYYMFRMHAMQPQLLLGIDPGLLQLMQFWAIEKYIQCNAYVLPLTSQNLPDKLNFFDVVFSMGVLYHRKSPLHHIRELAACLTSKGQLIIETLIVDGDENTCLFPQDRYAQMRNVWFLPSIKMLTIMLQRNGFKNIRCIDITTTTTEEQRTTDWMKFHSLKDFLNSDQNKTIEGYDLPKRATLIAEKK